MTTNFASMTLSEICKLEGVSDLPMKVKGKLAQALKLESEGKYVEANTKLLEACDEEAKLS